LGLCAGAWDGVRVGAMERQLERATREELLAVIARQADVISQQENVITQQEGQIEALQARVAELERKLGGPGSGRGVPEFVKPRQKKAGPSRPRKRRAQALLRLQEGACAWPHHSWRWHHFGGCARQLDLDGSRKSGGASCS
jgi:hypothetical protein